MKKLCSSDGCYHFIDTEDIILMGDGNPHPTSLKCRKCISEDEWKKFKKYRKNRRKRINRKKRREQLLNN